MRFDILASMATLTVVTALAAWACCRCSTSQREQEDLYRSQSAFARLGAILQSLEETPETFASLHAAVLNASPDLSSNAFPEASNPFPAILPGSKYGRQTYWSADDNPSNIPVLWTAHTDKKGRRAVLFLNGHVYVLTPDGRDMGGVTRFPSLNEIAN